MQPLWCNRDLVDQITLYWTCFLHQLPTYLFIVLCLLSTAWGAGTVLSIASQVVTPSMWCLCFPTISGCEHISSTSIVVISSCPILWDVSFRRCGHSHDSRATARSSFVETRLGLVPLCVDSHGQRGRHYFILLIPSSTSTLFFRSRAHSSLITQGLLLPCLFWAPSYLIIDNIIFASLLL